MSSSLSLFRRSARIAAPHRLVQARSMASSLVAKFEESIEKLPMREAVKYTSIKEGKWTFSELKVHIQKSFFSKVFVNKGN
jgi:hypothetical protein